MRKAIARKGTRRKHDDKGLPNSPTNSVGTDGTDASKRKATEGEAVLTAKNYRLAKELSDLRVRHREETKNVTRLTMENMNLASRCREAISHVAMLKKELAMHQRRSAEALALQRQQQQQQVNGSISTEITSDKNVQSATDVAAEMDRMDRLMAVHAPPPPPPNPPSRVLSLPPQVSLDAVSPKGEFFSDYDEKKSGPPSSGDESEDELGPEVGFAKDFSKAPSPRVHTNVADYNEGFPDDLPRSARKKSASFLPSAPEIAEVESDTNSVSSNQSDYRRTIMSSIDAFEASFSTSFPESFSSSQEVEVKSASEIYNPFFPSPTRKENKSSLSSSSDTTKAMSGSASSQITSKETNIKETIGVLIEQLAKAESSIDEILPSTPPKVVRDVTPHFDETPGSQEKSMTPTTPISLISRKVSNDEFDEPSRPEKRPSASARARYEKALQSRTYQTEGRSNSARHLNLEGKNNDDTDSRTRQSEPEISNPKPSSVAKTKNTEGSTAHKVLQRLQQRRNNSPSVTKPLRSASPSSLKPSPRQPTPTKTFKSLSGGVFSKTQPASSKRSSEPVIPKADQQTKTPDILVAKSGISPSISSAINVFEQAAKRNECLNLPAGRANIPVPKRSASLGESNRPTSPGLPFDEPESPNRSYHRTVSSPEIEQNRDYSERPNYEYTRGIPARGWQPSTRHASIHGNRTMQMPEDTGESEVDDVAMRSNMRFSEFPHAKGSDRNSYLAQPTNYGSAARNSLRNVTKPLSYAEPSLNSKLRQGDVYFPKNDSDKRGNNEDVRTDYMTSVRL